MKTNLLTLLILVLLTGISCQEKIDTEKETKAIKEVIEGLMKSHAEHNFDNWIEKWVNQPYVFLSYTDSAGNYVFNGRTELDTTMKALFAEDKKNGNMIELEAHDYTIKVYQKSAWAKFWINWKLVNGDENEFEWETLENYVFEKIDEDWKIVTVNAIEVSSFK